MLSIVVLLAFFAMLGAMLLGDKRLAYVWVFLSVLFFPPCVYFLQKPQVSPQQVFLYIFFIVSLLKNRSVFMDAVFKHPLRVPLLFLFISLMLTSVLTGEGVKGIYNVFRYYMENYAYLIVAFVGGLNYDKIQLEKKWFIPVMILFFFGVIEYVFRSNYLFPFICKAFPYYDGYYDLSSAVSASRSYRTRIFLTTTHPTVLGCMLCGALMLFTCRLKSIHWSSSKLWMAWGALFLMIFMSGSRTAMVCALIGLVIFAFMKVGIRMKFMIIVLVGFIGAAVLPKAVDAFSVEGQGSSVSLRQEQLLFSYLQFMKSPIYGNGVRYTSKYVMERDTYNDRVVDDEIGGLESVIFFTLIDYGMVGIATYLMLFLMALFYFIRHSHSTYAQAGFLITICFFIFACLSGEIGGNNTFAYLLMGYCMGAVYREEELEDDDEKEKSLDGNDSIDEAILEGKA